MKKLFTFLTISVLTAATAFSQVEINEANFPDENFRNWLLKQSYGADGTLSANEIVSIQTINVSSLQITDLTGINYFTSLKFLDCYDNLLNSLDVSQLAALQYLNCWNNQLTSLDVSNLKSLKGVERYNQTPTLTLTLQDDGVYSLAIALNNPTGFVDGITYADGKLTSSSKTIASSPFEVDVVGRAVKMNGTLTLLYRDNALPECDGGIAIDETNFPDDNFRAWALAQSWGKDACISDSEIVGITSINVSGKGIKDLTGIGYFTALTELYCYNNELTLLDVSNLTNLETLNCSNNQLIRLDVSDLNNLAKLNCDNQSPEFELITEKGTNVPVITNSVRQIIGFYSILGAKLDKKPQSGVYIVLYNNGETEKVAKK
ncbi:MAG: hypothetical protein FWC39_09105 [Bacteroidetes bacterium]|nr:hypothetical protein [Bacteroidota bacterium]